MYYPMYYDPTYILVLIGVVICMAASARVNSTYSRYSRTRNHAGITGAMAAQQILNRAGIYDVRIEHVSGKLTDHFDPRSKVVRLSDTTYNSTSVAALGVAAHECGHVIQHATGYAPLSMRTALVPVVNFGSTLSWPLILIGLFLNGNMFSFLINLGIWLFTAVVVFQLVTLPVEFNASSRAMRILEESGMLYPEEAHQARKVLSAAAMTYVASAASAILQLLRLLILTGGRRGNDD